MPAGRRRYIIFSLLLMAGMLCWGCHSGTSAHPKSRQVNLYVWSAYIPQKTLSRFEQETGIQLNFSTYDSNEALLEKMGLGVADYDVIVPSDYMVTILKREKLLKRSA